MKIRTPIFGSPQKAIAINPKATEGATLGVDLKWPDGSLVTASQLGGAVPAASGAYSASTAGGSAASPSSIATVINWSSILGIPANVLQVAAQAAAGLVTRLAGGTWVERVLTGTAGRIVVTNGDGASGNPAVDLATVGNSGTGALQAFAADGFGRITGTRAPTTDDLPQGVSHFYDRTLVFTQGTASTSWSIAHNMGKFPSVTVVNTAGDEVEADVTFIDANNLSLAFASAFSGSAYLN